MRPAVRGRDGLTARLAAPCRSGMPRPSNGRWKVGLGARRGRWWTRSHGADCKLRRRASTGCSPWRRVVAPPHWNLHTPPALPDVGGSGAVVRLCGGRRGATARDPRARHLLLWGGHTIHGGERQHKSWRGRQINGGRRWICGGEAWRGRGGAHPGEVAVVAVVQERGLGEEGARRRGGCGCCGAVAVGRMAAVAPEYGVEWSLGRSR